MLVAAAVVPATPMILPEVSPGTEASMAPLRAATATAVQWLLAGPAQVLWVVAVTRDQPEGEALHGILPAGAEGDLAGYGLPELSATLGAGAWSDGAVAGLGAPVLAGGARLPVELVLAGRLLGDRAGDRAVRGVAVREGMSGARAAALGAGLAGLAARVVLLVCADGSARGDAASPGHLHAGAHALDDEVAAALTAVDTTALAELDPVRCEQLWFAGRAGLQLVAGAAAAAGDVTWKGRLDCADRPHGVGLFVARWLQARSGPAASARRPPAAPR